MKKFKKLIALTCIAAMLVPTLAFAADGEYTGDGVIENNNAPKVVITNVVLPTITSDTYNFTIDAEELLANVDSDNYDAIKADGVWFSRESTAATLTINPDNASPAATYNLYEQVKKPDTGLTIITAALAGKTAATLVDTDVENYYVWVPVVTTGSEGEQVRNGDGQFVQLTASTITNYFTITYTSGVGEDEFTSIAAKQHTTGANIFDGELYYNAYDPITEANAAAKYYNASATSLNDGLYVTTTPDGGAEGAPTVAVIGTNPGELTYTAAKFTNEGSSSTATIVNKSTFDIAVTAKVTVDYATALTFTEKAALETDTDDASLYMAIKNGASNVATISGTAGEDGSYATAPSATAYYVITGTGEDNSTLYQTAGPEAITGSHQYYKFLDPITSYNSADFTIEAAVSADDDWDAYVEAVKEAGDAPNINVVYTWAKVEKTDAVSGLEYADEDGNTYTAASISDGWATKASADQAPSIATTSVSYSRTSGATISVNMGSGTKVATGATLQVSSDNQNFMSYTGGFTLENGTLTLAGGYMTAPASGTIRYVKVAFNDTSNTVITLTLTLAD